MLFLCVHNAGRSQMAAGWLRHLAGGAVDVVSGGSKTIPPVSCLGPVSDPDCATGIYNPPCGDCLELEAVEYTAAAQVTFYAQEETSGEKFTLVRGLNVFVGQFADE